MIYHAFHLDPATGKPATTWWAVHAETLTPIRITKPEGRSKFITMEVVAPPPGEPTAFASHPDHKFDPSDIRFEVAENIREHLDPYAAARLTKLSTARADIEVPEHLLVFDGAGEHPAIFRTQFPRIIIPVNPDNEEILGTPTHWIAREDLTAHGWEYFWTGCQQALDELAPTFIASQA